ncbi:MAG: ABC transporter permease [Desulfovibrionaceae bacterium]
MNASLLIARKDLCLFFRAPLGYLVLACFLLVSGYFFVASVSYYELVSIQLMQNPQLADFTPTEMVLAPYLQNAGVILLFFLPLLTMRGFAEEKRSGAFELLVSYPVSEAQLVGGKLLALGVFLLAMLAASAVGPLLLFLVSTPEPLPALVGYGGLFLMVTAFASLGLFLSTLTENQIVSAALSFAALLVLWLLSWIKDAVPAAVAPVVDGLSPLAHYASFTRGVLDLADVVYFATFILAFFWLAVLSLENQRSGR